MSGDYTRFSFDPLKRYAGVGLQQGRVQLNSDWNEEIDILRRRLQTTTRDVLGPLGVPAATAPVPFTLNWIAGPPADLTVTPGRLYVDGIQIECFAEDNASYLNQPFYPPQLGGFPPQALPTAGDAVAYLDVWEREITYIEDPQLLDVALGGADTTTRRQTVWQLRVDPVPGALCGMAVGEAPSAGRLTSKAIAPPAPDDPCILPPASGYRGLENRLYRVEIHDGGALGTARFKWSRDNGSIVSAVRDIAVSGSQTTLSVNRIGRDKFLRFKAGDWVTVTDDHRELTFEPGEMAMVVNIDETNRQIVLDRALPSAGARPFGANADAIAARHTRVQRWDQTGATNAVDGDGLIATAAGPIAIEDGIEIQFATVPAAGAFRQGDYWTFWARTATAQIEELTAAPPQGINHQYMQIAALTGIGSSGGPTITPCFPTPPGLQAADCCCTIVIKPGDDIQAGIDALPSQGGCVCLKTGLHTIRQTLTIKRPNITLRAESPGTTVLMAGVGPVLIIGNAMNYWAGGVDILGIDFTGSEPDKNGGLLIAVGVQRLLVSHCSFSSQKPSSFTGIIAIATRGLNVIGCRFSGIAMGMLVGQRCENFEADSNIIELGSNSGPGYFGIVYAKSPSPCRVTRNAISNTIFAIYLNDQVLAAPSSLADRSIVADNFIICPELNDQLGNINAVAIDVAASECKVTGNRVSYQSNAYIGIRISGSLCEVNDNVVMSAAGEINSSGPTAIAIGAATTVAIAGIAGGVVAHNMMLGAQNGIVCGYAAGLVIDENTIAAVEMPAGFAIFGTRLTASAITGNRIGNSFSAVLCMGGRNNRIAGNDCESGRFGISIANETGPQVSGNRLNQLQGWGVLAGEIGARLDIGDNRLTRCGTALPQIGFAIGCGFIAGEANITGNEVMDTGSDGGQQASTTADYGIVAMLALEARVEGNLVTYANVATRNPSREDRALLMQGMFDWSQGDNEPNIGFAVQILGNKFTGTGRSALIELRETVINDQTYIRFQRVSFDNNYCMHLAEPVFKPGAEATVVLVGRQAIVMGNHIKAQTFSLPSVNFNGMPGPFIGNITVGGTTNHADFPAPAASFNMRTF